MFGPWMEAGDMIRRQIPFWGKKKRLTFISIHYMYMIGMSMAGSLLMYASGGLRYIDALFFASGAATQSGLNTVDCNKLHTYQQLVLYFIAMLCNPIIIHSFVVFVRLYWFERRFQHVVREARSLRRTKTRSRTNTQAIDDGDNRKEEEGVNGRNIVVVRSPKGTDGAVDSRDVEKNDLDPVTESVNSSKSERNSGESSKSNERLPPKLQTNVDPVESPESAPLRVPELLSPERHLAFLERQKNPENNETLRIPSPREWDRGGLPETVKCDEDGGSLAQHITNPVEQHGSLAFMTPPNRVQSEEQPHFRSHITIDEPSINHIRTNTTTFPKAAPRRVTAEPNEAPPNSFLKSRSGTFSSILRPATSSMGSNSQENRERDPMPYLSWQPTIGRNSAFFDLNEKQREELGGIEYRALKTLALVLVGYFIAFHLLGVICLVPWILRDSKYGEIVEQDGQGRPWWGIFTAASALNDLGFTLTPDSMISFGDALLPMLLMTFLIVIGNTGFPCMLRFIIWALSKMVPEGSGVWEEFRFLLDHPRRCFTLLFPGAATWWLFWILVILNGTDLVFFIILDLNDPTVNAIPGGYRFVDGLFQASSTRTAGFSVVNLSDLHPAIQVSYLIMMYISVFPIAISMRRTNVYEEKSLGIYAPEGEDDEDPREPSYVGAHLRKQLGFDLWYVFLGLFVIAIVEGGRLQNPQDQAFTLFSVLFEIVSAYGTVGLSLGYPGINASFSAEFKVLSKLVMVTMQIRGRHRGLPYDLDRAILLPSESLQRKETQDAERRGLRRRNSTASTLSRATSRFHQEPGLSTGHDGPPEEVPHGNAVSRDHHSHVRQGLGTAMARLSEHPELTTSQSEKDKGD